MTNRLGAAAVTTLCFIAAACGKEAAPTAGPLVVSLVTPSTDDGAVRLTLGGGRIESVTVVNPEHQIFIARPEANTVRVIVTGAIAAGPLLRMDVPDVAAVESYFATLHEAAERGTFAQKPLDGYSAPITVE